MLSYSLGEISAANNILLYCGYLMHFEKHLQGTKKQSSKEVKLMFTYIKRMSFMQCRYGAKSTKKEFVLFY